jgi:hypothetical protein
MSAICILTPVVMAAWPAFGAAVTAAAASLGYQVVAEARNLLQEEHAEVTVALEVPRSEIVTGSLGRDQKIRCTREGVTVTFARDARGRATVCVTGTGQSEEGLRAVGEAFSQGVVQQYVYQKLTNEMRERGYQVVEEEVSEDQVIRMRVRHWEG